MAIARLVLSLAAVFTAALPAPSAAAGGAYAVTRVEVTSDAGADTTQPRLVRGEVDGATMRLTFSEALDPDATTGRFNVQVQTSATGATSFFATGGVSIDGEVVTVGLGDGNPRATAGLLDQNQVFYYRPPAHVGGGLRDLAGNPVRAPYSFRGRLRTQFVKLDNVTEPAAPAVTKIEVTSAAGADATYTLGESIEVTVTFSEAVAVTGAPRLKLALGTGEERWAAYRSGSGTAVLGLAWTVAEGDVSGAGVAVLANTLALDGGTVRSVATGKDAALGHAGLAHDANHKVDGTLPDTTPPRLATTEVNGPTLTLDFDEAIDGASSPASGTFTVKRTPSGGSEQNVRLSGPPAIEGVRVTLTLEDAVRDTDTDVRVSYRKSASNARNRLKDKAGNEVVEFTNQPVTNNTPDTTPPRLVRGEIDGGNVTLFFSEALAPDSKEGWIWMQVEGRDASWSISFPSRDAQVSGRVVKFHGSTATAGLPYNPLWYSPPTSDPTKGLRDLAGNAVWTPDVYCTSSCRPRTRTIILDNVTGMARTVTGVEVSSNAGGDATYGRGDTIRVRLTFNKSVAVTGMPRVKLDLSSATGDEKWADYTRGDGTRALEFAYTVAENDASSAGVAVIANSLALNGGTIRSAAGADAVLSHAGLEHDPAHRVDWQQSRAPAVTDVAISSDAGADDTYAEGETIVVRLTFSEAVAVTGTPRVKLDFGHGTGGGKWADYADGGGTTMLEFAYTVAKGDTASTGVAVIANSLALDGGTIRSATTQTDADRVHTGLDHDSTHKVDSTTPALFQAALDGATLTLIFDEALGAAASLANGAFTVKKTPQGGGEQEVSLTGSPAISDASVTLTLSSAVLETDTDVKVSYARPTSGTGNRLRDEAGNEVASFTNEPVRKGSPDTTPPRLERGEIDGGTVTLFFSEALDPNSVGGRFRVTVYSSDHSSTTFAATGDLEISGIVATIGLGSGGLWAKAGVPSLPWQSNRIYYVAPTDPGKGLQDLAGNPLQTPDRERRSTRVVFLDNVTGVALTVTEVEVSSGAGDDDTYGLGETIRVRLTFSKAVNVTGTPRVKIGFSSGAGDEQWADYESGSGTSTLEFAYTVGQGDAASAGVAVLENTLELNGGTIRSTAAGENANLAHAGVDYNANHKVDSRPTLSVADARANEGTDTAVSFEVRLSRAATGAVTVDYATSDGTATAGADYTATSGTLTFAAGETAKTVNVPVLDDALSEGEETFTLTLSNAAGARIVDGEATGTIANDDPLQKIWLSRFGRTVASHVTEAVSDRLAAPLAGAQVTVSGQRVDLARAGDEAWLGQTLTSLARALGAREGSQPEGDGWPGTGMGGLESPGAGSAPARALSEREFLRGSAFHLGAEGEGGGPGLAAWGRVTAGGFDGEAPADAGSVRIDGEVTTGILGADAEWDRLLAGVAISVSEGEGTFAQPGVDSGAIESTMTTVSPYARVMLNDRVSTWGLAGRGTGDMTIVQAANDRGQRERVTRTDLEMRLAALGGRGALLEADEAGGMDLGLRADAFWVETEAEAVSNEGGTTADASRVRLILEGSRAFGMESGGVLTPGVELGLRHDGGDAETGTGVELGGRVSYENPDTGLGVEAGVRTLLAHEDSDYREWGASGAVRLDPGARGRGLSFSLAPTYGAASSGVERLWSARDAQGMVPGGEFEARQRLEGEVGYGLGLFGGLVTGTPNVGFGLSDNSQAYRIGWRLTSAVRGDPGFEVNLDATRREPANPGSGAGPEHGVMLRGAIRW